MIRGAAKLGAITTAPNCCHFCVWAPNASALEIVLLDPEQKVVAATPKERGYFELTLDGIGPGTRYLYRLDAKKERPDPASRLQPDGVHGPSAVVDPNFPWQDQHWFGLPLRDYVLYELHVGTFTPEGTFDAIVPHLPALKELGATALELMPVAQFPGHRNWGYDGAYPFSVQSSYGGADGLRRLVNAAHQQGFAVVLDVVYNHLGPEGNYLTDFGPYFTERHHTSWGSALNFDGAHSDEVRRYFVENALCWQTEYHIDALRLDAIHAIHDCSPIPFLEELAEACHRQAEVLNRRFHLIGESDQNMARHILPRAAGGHGLDAQWSDDFHHALHVLLTGERDGYYADYAGVGMLAKIWREGYAYTGDYSQYRQRTHGSRPHGTSAKQFVVCLQNHDQIGNRRLGDRLSATASFERLKLGAGTVLLSPFVPLLFMGEEYGETAPFHYFVSHSDPELVVAVRQGRSQEFASFGWQGEVPDAQAETTFQACKLNHALAGEGQYRVLREFYQELIALRKALPALALVEKDTLEALPFENENVLLARCWCAQQEATLVFAYAPEPVTLALPLPKGRWYKRLDSAAPKWNGPGSRVPDELKSSGEMRLDLNPTSFVLLTKTIAE
jgi:maltooligosyltrehalose trehalohydrolase